MYVVKTVLLLKPVLLPIGVSSLKDLDAICDICE